MEYGKAVKWTVSNEERAKHVYFRGKSHDFSHTQSVVLFVHTAFISRTAQSFKVVS